MIRWSWSRCRESGIGEKHLDWVITLKFQSRKKLEDATFGLSLGRYADWSVSRGGGDEVSRKRFRVFDKTVERLCQVLCDT